MMPHCHLLAVPFIVTKAEIYHLKAEKEKLPGLHTVNRIGMGNKAFKRLDNLTFRNLEERFTKKILKLEVLL